jgi:hypothetical protein
MLVALRYFFDRDKDKVAPIIKGILDAHSPRISNLRSIHVWTIAIFIDVPVSLHILFSGTYNF